MESLAWRQECRVVFQPVKVLVVRMRWGGAAVGRLAETGRRLSTGS